MNTPLLGVLFYALGWNPQIFDPVTNAEIVLPVTGTTLFGAGAGDTTATGGPGFVKWDPAGSTPEAPVK